MIDGCQDNILNGYLDESIYMCQPEGFKEYGQEQKVCKLKSFIHGLEQAFRSWSIRFDIAIKSYGFIWNVNDPVYSKGLATLL